MHISVVLCTYNRCQSLVKSLGSLAASTVPDGMEWEVVVVDNNSSDQTRAIADYFCLQNPHFVYLFEPQQGLSYARNAGIRKARGEIIAFTDDDDIVEPDWVWRMNSVLQSGKCIGAGGRIIAVWPKPLPRWLCTDDPDTMGAFGELNLSAEPGPLARPPYGGNMAFRREAFAKYGGFRVDLGRSGTNLQGREDVEFANRLLAAGERLWYEPRAIVRAAVPASRMEAGYVMRWWYWYGRSEVAELGPPAATRSVQGVPLYLFHRLVRWSLQWMISLKPATRFSCRRKVWYITGTIVACYQGRRSRRVPGGAIADHAAQHSVQTPPQAGNPR